MEAVTCFQLWQRRTAVTAVDPKIYRCDKRTLWRLVFTVHYYTVLHGLFLLSARGYALKWLRCWFEPAVAVPSLKPVTIRRKVEHQRLLLNAGYTFFADVLKNRAYKTFPKLTYFRLDRLQKLWGWTQLRVQGLFLSHTFAELACLPDHGREWKKRSACVPPPW